MWFRHFVVCAATWCSIALSSIVILPGGEPKAYAGERGVTTLLDFFNGSAENEFTYNKAQVILSSFNRPTIAAADGIRPSGNSLVRGAIQAWGEHLHLVIRPEEVWFTILVQMNFYMNSHGEELRDMFVDHKGQEVIYVEDLTWYEVLRRFQFEIQKRVKIDWLLDWIRPNFTTTTETDIMTANILMMGLTQTFYRYEGGLVCGLPSVTLLGEEKDWKAILDKVDRLADFGEEPKVYASRLRPVLTRFVRSFREPDSKEIRAFWNNIVVAQRWDICGGPPLHISGWITVFEYWNDRGRPYGRPSNTNSTSTTTEDWATIDGVRLVNLDITRIPIGYARAPFIMRNHSGMDRFPAYVAAGTMGKQITPGAPAGYAEALRRAGGDLTLASEAKKDVHAMLKPLSNWMLYGPVNHTAEKSWLQELEPGEMVFGIRRSMTGQICRAGGV